MNTTPTRAEFALARLRYERTRLRAWWRITTGRCAGCPKTRRGPHKFGCNKPTVPPGLRTIRKGT